jgi:hypothetical protein
MSQQNQQLRVAMKPVAEAFEELQVPYAVMGSVAGLTHGYSRFTMDIDVVAFLHRENVAAFVSRLQDDYYVDENMIRDAIRHHRSFNLLHHETGLKVDVFIPTETEWNRQVTARRKPEMMDEEASAFWVQTAEDLVLSKLRWFRATNETPQRQWSDVLGVLKMQMFNLDFDYMGKWAREIKVFDLLERALDESGITEKETN